MNRGTVRGRDEPGYGGAEPAQAAQPVRQNAEGRQDARARALGPRGWHSRGYLPHFDGGAIVQMVTFRLADSFPRHLLAAWAEELARLPEQALAAEQRRRIEAHLDTGAGAAWLADARIARLVQESLLHFDGCRYRLYAWVIMPNHVHLLVEPLDDYNLPDIIASWKSYTATRANQLLGRQGAFWHREYFDRYIRDERHFTAAAAYIAANPVRAGLCATAADWPFGSAGFPGTENPHPDILPAPAPGTAGILPAPAVAPTAVHSGATAVNDHGQPPGIPAPSEHPSLP